MHKVEAGQQRLSCFTLTLKNRAKIELVVSFVCL